MQKINKNSNQNRLNLNQPKTVMEQRIMNKIIYNEIKMKPKWLFLVGSVSLGFGIIGASIGASFLLNLTLFLLFKKGPGYGRLNLLLSSFPWWIPLLAILGITIGVFLLRKYDFSYKKNFLITAGLFILSIIIAAIILDVSGLNTIWTKRGPMHRFYQHIEGQNKHFPDRKLLIP